MSGPLRMATMPLPFPASADVLLQAIADRYRQLQALPGSPGSKGHGYQTAASRALETEIAGLSRRYRVLTGAGSSAEGGAA